MFFPSRVHAGLRTVILAKVYQQRNKSSSLARELLNMQMIELYMIIEARKDYFIFNT